MQPSDSLRAVRETTAWVDRPAPIERLRPEDLGMFWTEGAHTPMNVALVAELEPGGLLDAGGGFDLEGARRELAARLVRTPRLRQRIHWPRFGEGAPAWVDDDHFELDRHVAVHAFARPASAEEWQRWCANEAIRPLDRHRPLWRLTFATGLASGTVGLLLVIHHAVVDGMAASALVAALLDREPRQRRAWPVTMVPAARVPGRAALMADQLRRLARALASCVVALPSLPGRLVALVRGVTLMSREFRAMAPVTAVGPSTGPTREVVVLRRPVAQLRDAGHRLGVTLNDLLLASLASALRALFLSRGDLPAGDRVRVMVPVAVPNGHANSCGGMSVPLDVRTPSDEGRLRAIAELTRRRKAIIKQAGPAASPLGLLPRPLAWLLALWMTRRGPSLVNGYVTNVPGPKEPLYFGTSRLLSMAPLAPLNASPLCVSALSYAGTLAISLQTDGELAGREVLAAAFNGALDAYAG